VFAAAGYSLIYLLLGGGFGGAVLIFIIAKMLGKWACGDRKHSLPRTLSRFQLSNSACDACAGNEEKTSSMIYETTIQEPTKEFSPDEDSIFTIWLDSQDDEPVTPETIISVASRFDKPRSNWMQTKSWMPTKGALLLWSDLGLIGFNSAPDSVQNRLPSRHPWQTKFLLNLWWKCNRQADSHKVCAGHRPEHQAVVDAAKAQPGQKGRQLGKEQPRQPPWQPDPPGERHRGIFDQGQRAPA
jgi:hypothetical protein